MQKGKEYSMSNTNAAETSSAFSQYPANADAYFLKNNTIINGLPKSIRQDIELDSLVITITSAQQYIEYIESERSFWKEHDPKGILNNLTLFNSFDSAQRYFSQAIQHYNDNNEYAGTNSMKQSTSIFANGHLCSKTKLASILTNHLDKGNDFINGFVIGLSKSRNNTTLYPDTLEGFIYALEYSNAISSLYAVDKKTITDFQSNAKQATTNYAILNNKYTSSFHNQEKRLADIEKDFSNQVQSFANEAKSYFDDKEKRCRDLETLYEEKLKLQAPAEYWEQVEKYYLCKGRCWLIVSIIFAILVIGGLVATLFFLPTIIKPESHWVEVIKNSAIITVITSIAIYLLRLFVKLSTSSYHLARDAKERNKLTYFYLALIEKKAVTEKERAIVLNSLFSRADTGLLKGDSSPTMSGNITDLIQSINK